MRSASRLLLSVAVAALMLGAVFFWGGTSPTAVVATIRRLPPATYAVALGLHIALYALRTARFRILLPPALRPSFGQAFAITSAYTLASLILPAKLGEAAFVVYLNRAGGVSAAEGIAALVVSRLLDLATLALGLSIACIALALAGSFAHLPWLLPLGIALALFALAILALSARGDLVIRVAAWTSRALRLDRLEAGRRVLARADQVAAALRGAGGRGRLLAAALVSLPAWLCVFLFCAVLARGLGLPAGTTLAEATFGSSLAILTSLLPVSAFANFGTLEAGWVLGFGALGVDAALASATGVGLHLVQIANAALLGLSGHVGMALLTQRRRA